jgi:phosphopantothenoylcysteine decarboxylase/phosphopantothenate--cysteine ligase
MNIIIGVSSGIACYKVIDLIKKLNSTSDINVIMTHNSLNLISPSEFEKASGNKVAIDLFDKDVDYQHYLKHNRKIKHTSLADKADLIVIVPATADIIGKIANGIADDILTTTVTAAKVPVLICPSMNVNMWHNRIVQENVGKLKKFGYYFVDPEYGMLACGYKGVGRLAKIDTIADKIENMAQKKDMAGKKVVVTAGPTYEEIDPVRIITNRSSGKLGYNIAESASLRGADVILITGPTAIDPPPCAKVVNVNTSYEMKRAVLRHYPKADYVIMAAAVADFKPKKSRRKIKKKEKLVLEMEKNIDILELLGKNKKNQILVGFALETSDLVKNAEEKLRKKNLDMIIANGTKTLRKDRSDFIIIKKGKKRKFLNILKKDMAEKILDSMIR